MQPSAETKQTEQEILQRISSSPNLDLILKNAEEYSKTQQEAAVAPKKLGLASRLKQKASERFGFNKEVDPNRRAFLKAAVGTAGLATAAVLTGLNPFSSSEAKVPEQPKPPDKPIKLSEELLKPLTDEVKKRRAEKSMEDPEFDIRVDQELNSTRDLNFLIIGMGSEIWYGEEDADAIIAGSYSTSDNDLGLVSIHRDTQSPEVFQEAQKKGLNPKWYESEIMRALRVGGIPLLEKVVESTTGLALTSDYYIELKKDALPDFIDKVFGKIKIDVPQDIPKDMYGMGPFAKGEQEMDGKRILEYFTSRTSTTMERRNSAQQQVMELMINEFINKFTTANELEKIGLLNNVREAFAKLQGEKKIVTDIPIDKVLGSAITRLPQLLSQIAQSTLAGSGLLERPYVKRALFGENAQLKRYDPNTTGPRKALMSYVDPVTKAQNVFDSVKMAGINTKALVSEYYKYPRQIVRQLVGKNQSESAV